MNRKHKQQISFCLLIAKCMCGTKDTNKCHFCRDVLRPLTYKHSFSSPEGHPGYWAACWSQASGMFTLRTQKPEVNRCHAYQHSACSRRLLWVIELKRRWSHLGACGDAYAAFVESNSRILVFKYWIDFCLVLTLTCLLLNNQTLYIIYILGYIRVRHYLVVAL